MGFAAGMYAGQKAAESAIDNFRSARKNRDERQVQAEIEGLQTKNAEEIESSTAAGGAYDAEQLRLASMSPQQLKAQQVGLGRTPAGSVPQMSPVDNPQFRPDPNQTVAQGLMTQPRNSELLSAYPVAPNSQQSRSPASGQAMGMGARPEQVAAITQSEMLRKREGLLRSRGQTEMADDVAIRASNQEDIAYRRDRDDLQDKRNEVIDSQRDQTFKQQLEINGFTIEDGQRTQQLRAAFEATAGMTDEEIFSSKTYQDLDAELKTAYLVKNTGLKREIIDSLNTSMKKKVSGAKTTQELLALFTAEDTLTAGTYVVMEKGEKGAVELVTYSDDDDVEQERMPFADEQMMARFMRTQATDPAMAAQSYSTEMKAAAATMTAYRQEIFENKMTIAEAVMKGTDTLINSEVFASLADDEKEVMKLQIFGPLEELMTPEEFTNLVGGIVIQEEGDNAFVGFLKDNLGGDPKTVSYSAQDSDPLQGSPNANKQQRLRSEITELEQGNIDAQPPLYTDQDGNLREPTPQEAIRQRQQGLGRGFGAARVARDKEKSQNARDEQLQSLYAELAELEGQNSANRSQARGLAPGK